MIKVWNNKSRSIKVTNRTLVLLSSKAIFKTIITKKIQTALTTELINLAT